MRAKPIDFQWRDIFIIAGPIAILVGFYYTTNWRLEQLENQTPESLETVKKVAVLEQRVIDMDRKIDYIYDAARISLTNQKEIEELKKKTK